MRPTPHLGDTRRSLRLGLDEQAMGGWGARVLVLSMEEAVCINEATGLSLRRCLETGRSGPWCSR